MEFEDLKVEVPLDEEIVSDLLDVPVSLVVSVVIYVTRVVVLEFSVTTVKYGNKIQRNVRK
jgi:hypothetical protein